MATRARDGTCLATLVKMAVPFFRQAEVQCPRTGPGRKPQIPDWLIAVLIMIVVLKRKKSKSAQYRYLTEHRAEIAGWIGAADFPARSTYFERYRRAHRLFQEAIRLQGEKAVEDGLADPTSVAVDKSLLTAQGPLWHKTDRKANRIPKGLHGVDTESTWGHSQYHGWVQGYSYEVVVTATANGTVWPLLASADTASASEHATFGDKITYLHNSVVYVLADSGYDNNDYGERIEWDEDGKRTGKRFLCPENPRSTKKDKQQRKSPPVPKANRLQRQRRRQRREFLQSRRGRKLYARRGQTVEPFNDWLKSLFELEHHVWHRGLDNNRTQFLAAIFTYQLLLRYNHRCGNHNGQLRWILDTL
jgi:hypothetical protein